ncbi:MAG: hypothetical protein NVSMB69_16140 [Novosphingobium sp.]
MKKLLLAAAAIGVALTATTADARQGCGPYGHRDYYGRCVPNRGGRPVVVAPGLVIGNFYRGRGYWDGHRYWAQRYRDHDRGDWRYRDRGDWRDRDHDRGDWRRH